jgi:hypothetical protein
VIFSDDENVDERRELIREYENFLLRKNFDITKLRLTARKHLLNKSKKNNLENVGTMLVKNIKSKTKSDYKKELRFYYMGDVQKVLEHETNIEEANPRFYYDWTYCYSFKNPDAQKKENHLSVNDAFEQIRSFFKEIPMINA